MKQSTLFKVIEERNEMCRRVLFQKGQEYATHDDALLNFRAAAALRNKTVEQVIMDYMTKHFVSVDAMVSCPGALVTDKLWDEKIGDLINYLYLLDAARQEREGKVSDG